MVFVYERKVGGGMGWICMLVLLEKLRGCCVAVPVLVCPRLQTKGVLSYDLATTKNPRLALDGGTKLPSYIIAICAGQSALESASSASRPDILKKELVVPREEEKYVSGKREVPESWVFLFLDSSGKARTSNLLINSQTR